MDKPKAITAAAHKLARLIYTMLTKGQEYTDQGQDYYAERYRERAVRALSKRTAKIGCRWSPLHRLENIIPKQLLGSSFLRGRGRCMRLALLARKLILECDEHEDFQIGCIAAESVTFTSTDRFQGAV